MLKVEKIKTPNGYYNMVVSIYSDYIKAGFIPDIFTSYFLNIEKEIYKNMDQVINEFKYLNQQEKETLKKCMYEIIHLIKLDIRIDYNSRIKPDIIYKNYRKMLDKLSAILGVNDRFKVYQFVFNYFKPYYEKNKKKTYMVIASWEIV